MATKKTKIVVKKKAPVAAKKVVKPAPKVLAKPAAKKLATPPKVAPKPAPKAAAEPKAERPPMADDDYRKMRKYTVPKLSAFLSPEGTSEVRARLGVQKRGELLASELITYLTQLEAEMPDWKAKRAPLPNGEKRKRGRPRKDATQHMPPPPKVNADAVLAAGANGTLLPPREPNSAAKPPPFKAPKMMVN